MLDLNPNKIRDLFDKDLSKVYEELGNMAVFPAVLFALDKGLSIEGSIEQKESDLAKKFFTQCRYDKTEDYIQTGKFRKINGQWNIEFATNYRIDNPRGSCLELASKLGTVLQLAFPQRMFMLVQDKKIDDWNHYAVMDFTKALEDFGLKFDFSECKDIQSLEDKKFELFNQLQSLKLTLSQLNEQLIFDPSFSEVDNFANYRSRHNFDIKHVDIFEKLQEDTVQKTLAHNSHYGIPLYKKKTDGINGFGISLMFDNRWNYPKFAFLNGRVMEYAYIDASAFNNPLLKKAGFDRDDIEMLLESMKKMDIAVEKKFF